MGIIHTMIQAVRLPITIHSIFKDLSAQRSFLQKTIAPVLSKADKENDGSLDESDFKKITGYYGLAVPAILGEAFCVLHGKKMSETERKAATSQGAMTGLFDDFFDKAYLSDDAIENMLAEETDRAKRSNEKLFDIFYKTALQHVPVKNKMQETLTGVYKAQVESKKQATKNITEQEVKHITFYKGGASLLFYRSAFLPIPSKAEEQLLYDLGSLMQLSNDIFDVYKDRENNITTLVTMASHIRPLRQLFRDLLYEYFAQAYMIGLAKKNVASFLSILSLGIFSRVFVCLDQLEKNEGTTGNEFLVQQYSRKQLICDMDTKKNMLRSARYHVGVMAAARNQ